MSHKRFASIKALVSSVSGVLNNNQDIIGDLDGKPFMAMTRSHYDGQGISLLRAIGIPIAFVNSEVLKPTDSIVNLVKRWNNLPSASKQTGEGGWPAVEIIDGVVGIEQIAPVEEWLNRLYLTFADCAVIGHDLVQLPLLKKAALRIAPAQAEEVVKQLAHYVTPRSGGNGALRDFANLMLEARGIDPTTLPTR